MFKFLSAPVLAVSIALTGFSTTPVRANNDDFAKVVAGFAALAIIGTAINESQKSKKKSHKKKHVQKKHVKKKKPKVVIHHHRPHKPKNRHHLRGHGHHQNYHQPRARHYQPNYSSKVVPGRCLKTYNTHRGQRRGFGQNCLARHGIYRSALPRFCKTGVTIRGNNYSIYTQRCLRNEGFQVSYR